MTIEIQEKGAFSEVKYYCIAEETIDGKPVDGLVVVFLDGQRMFFDSVKDTKPVSVRNFD